MPVPSQGKYERIRALALEGMRPSQIIAQGYARSTVHAALRPRNRAQRPAQAVLEDILSLQVETLRLLRQLLGQPAALDPPDTPEPAPRAARG